MKHQRIYISGKISGEQESSYFVKFKNAQIYLETLGFEEVVNPLDIHGTNPVKSWEEFMVTDIEALFSCTAVYFLKDWQDSKGARIEFAIAREMGLDLFFEKSLPQNNQ
ncbi:MAG: hypothetical protein C4K58_06800 [Flavobacteriaceae bacterium]|nr:MAG: hypothetical protein C4K58_06800 [Flavobacteriaceae bacterium]